MVAQTGNTYLSGITIDSVEIPTAILWFWFSTMESSRIVPQMIAKTTDKYGNSNMAAQTGTSGLYSLWITIQCHLVAILQNNAP